MGKLSVTACETARADVSRDRLLGDGDGLFLRIRPNGTKTWVIEYVFSETRTKYTIGTYTRNGGVGESISAWLRNGQLSLSQARSIAGSWKARRRAGFDPRAEWEALLLQEQEAIATQIALQTTEQNLPTVGAVVELFMARMIEGKKSAPSVRYRLDRLVSLLGNKKIRDVTRQDVIVALDTIAKGQREGRTAKQLSGEILTQAKRLWRFAKARELIASSCVEELTRRDFDARPTKRDVTLRLDELATILRLLDDHEKCKSDPVVIAAMKLLILTGQRESEVCEAEWSEFNFKEGLWIIPAERTKSSRSHLVHLAPQALEILNAIKLITGKMRYVFQSPIRKNQPIYGRSVNNALGTLFKSGKLPKVTFCHVHDFRRTLITRLPDLGFEPFLGHKIANHVLSGVFGHYNHNSYEKQRRDALFAWALELESRVLSREGVEVPPSSSEKKAEPDDDIKIG